MDSFFKSDEGARQWAFLSALLALRQRAKQEGGDVVINVVSFYKTFLSPAPRTTSAMREHSSRVLL